MRVEPAVWLRAALAAALLATALASAFDLTVSERVVDRAVAREQGAMGSHALAVPEQFTRREQRGGLVLAELLYAVGSAALVAGVAILLGRTARPAQRWLVLSSAAAWALVPFPPLSCLRCRPGPRSLLTARTAGDLRPGGCYRGGRLCGCRVGLATSGGLFGEGPGTRIVRHPRRGGTHRRDRASRRPAGGARAAGSATGFPARVVRKPSVVVGGLRGRRSDRLWCRRPRAG